MSSTRSMLRGSLRLLTSPWALAALVAGAGLFLALGLGALRPLLASVLPGDENWNGDYAKADQMVRSIVGDTTEAPFCKSALSGVVMFGGATLGHWAYVTRRRRRGFDIAYGGRLWPWLTVSTLLGLVLSNLIWGWTIGYYSDAWQPAFVPFVSVPPAVVLVYGRGWRVALTGAVLGSLLTTPVSIVMVNEICVPFALPSGVGNSGGMAIGALFAFAVCRVLPWMPQSMSPPDDPTVDHHDPAGSPPSSTTSRGWVPRRILADFSEAPFYGNEWASVGRLLGVVLAFLLIPQLPVYGSGRLPALLAAQVLSAAIAVPLWRSRWAEAGWYPSFVPVVSVAPACVVTFGGSVQAVVAGAVLGALAGPPLAAAIARRLPTDFHPFIGNVASMAICTAVIVPLLKLLPGFATL
jgi:hypothetical protein